MQIQICSFALSDTLYLIRDTTQVNFILINQTIFCPENSFSLQNEHIQINVNETAEITIINTDVFTHSFTIDGIVDETLSPNSTTNISFSIPTAGTFRYYSSSFNGEANGASGILLVGYQNEICYFWNLNDVNSTLSHDVSDLSISELPLEYDPDLFFINGYIFPNTLDDTNGYIQQTVGDEIYISIINSGNMEHTLHFHGYHVEILDMKINNYQEGWIKDSFPLKLAEAMTVKLVPHQSGEYPVHDHNLIAVTNAGFYPGGMITRLNITE